MANKTKTENRQRWTNSDVSSLLITRLRTTLLAKSIHNGKRCRLPTSQGIGSHDLIAKRKSSGRAPISPRISGRLYRQLLERMAEPEFFILVAAIAALAGAMILGCRWVVKFQE
jgi:hypothetical protein